MINKDDLRLVKLPNTPHMHELNQQMYAAKIVREREAVFTQMQNQFDTIEFLGEQQGIYKTAG